ncbi:MAG: hypothetical protein K2W33_19640 [Burkholderiales bacterium]|nr:hypothetical protein [Burkholderiales bacterium]
MPLPLINHLIRLLTLLAWLALTGCSTVMRVDSTVQSHAQWPASAFTSVLISYEFERLPSQTTGQAGTDQDMLEAQTRQALAAVG